MASPVRLPSRDRMMMLWFVLELARSDWGFGTNPTLCCSQEMYVHASAY